METNLYNSNSMTHYHWPFHQKQQVLLNCLILNQGPVVLSIVTSTSSLVVKILTVLVSSISNSQVFLLKNVELLQMQKLLTFFLMMWLKKAPSRSKWVKCHGFGERSTDTAALLLLA